jgi:hypothetical protein
VQVRKYGTIFLFLRGVKKKIDNWRVSLFDRTLDMHTDYFSERLEVKGHIRDLDISKIIILEYILKNQGTGIAQSV